MSSHPAFNYHTEDEVVNAAKHIMESRMVQNKVELTSPILVQQYLSLRLGCEEREIFCVLFLDTQNRLVAAENLFLGTHDGASVFPREVVKAALKHNAASLIISHNHPSGVLEASKADINITKRLQTALELVDVRILDHFIVSGMNYMSFAERGLI